MPDGDYFILMAGDGQPCGGAMAAQNAEAPAMWLSWVEVEDVDGTVAAIGRNGGQALSPMMDIPNVGRMSVVADPTGGVFGVITPAAKA